MHRSNARQWLGILFVVLGGLILIKNLDVFNFYWGRIIFSWQMVILIIGIVLLVKARGSFAGLILVVIAGLSLAGKIFHFRLGNFLSEYWPLLLIILGVYIIFKHGSKLTHNDHDNGVDISSEEESDLIEATSVLNSLKRKYTTENFKGGKITVVLGGAEIDLTECNFAKGERVLDVMTIFGGAEVFIPEDWTVDIKAVTIFGGFEDKRRRVKVNNAPDKMLVVKGFVLFGGGEILN